MGCDNKDDPSNQITENVADADKFYSDWKGNFNDLSVGFTYDKITRIFFLENGDFADFHSGDEYLARKYFSYKGVINSGNIKVYTNTQMSDEYVVAFVSPNSIYAQSCNQMFYGCTNLVEVDTTNFKTNYVTDMQFMFAECKKFKGASSYGGDQVTNMYGMFQNCSSLTGIDSIQCKNVTNMNLMFYGCSSMTKVNLGQSSSQSTSKVTYMGGMFYGCSSLTAVVLGSYFNTQNVTSMMNMFEGCSSLSKLDLSVFNTSKVTSFYDMFKDCSNLKELYLGNFAVSSSANVLDMLNLGTSNRIRVLKTPYSVGKSITITTGSILYDTSTGDAKTSIGTSDANKTFAIKIDVTLNGNGGQWADGSTQSHVYFYYSLNKFYSNSSCTTAITAVTRPTKTGYSYDESKGFYTTSSVNGFSSGKSLICFTGTEFYSTLHTSLWSNVTLTCDWTINQYTLAFDSNGGILESVPGGTVSSKRIKANYGSKLSDFPNPTKTGYTFGGW